MKRAFILVGLVFFLCQSTFAHESHGRKIVFPDVPGFVTLKCDLHQHTVFSDGYVWPTIRVEEALKDGLDAIAVTEHLEYQPHKDDIPHPDRNKAFQIEVEHAKDSGLIIIPGAEVTRSLPPGHSNALFLDDANKLLLDEPINVFREAKKQNAFIFWNHPHWIAQQKNGVATLTELHKNLLAEGLLNGIEVVNEFSYSDEALQIALDRNLTIMGCSDIHGFIDWEYSVPDGGHRPITLVFAKEKSLAGIKEGLESRQTVVFYNDILIGRQEQLLPLLNVSLVADSAKYFGDSSVLNLSLTNKCSSDLILQNKSNYTFHNSSDVFTVQAESSANIEVKTIEKLQSISIKLEVLNGVVAPQKHAEIELKTSIK